MSQMIMPDSQQTTQGKRLGSTRLTKGDKQQAQEVELYLHAADDHAWHNLAGVAHHHVLSAVHVQSRHAWGILNHAQPGQTLHACI